MFISNVVGTNSSIQKALGSYIVEHAKYIQMMLNMRNGCNPLDLAVVSAAKKSARYIITWKHCDMPFKEDLPWNSI